MARDQAGLENRLRRGDASARALCAEFSISQPTFSRLVSRSPNIISYGAKENTSYTLRAPIGAEDRFPVYVVNEEGGVGLLGDLIPVIGGRFIFSQPGTANRLYDGVPWFLHDMRPQGFLGRQFPLRHSSLGLPADVSAWSDAQLLQAISRYGDDFPGNLIVGELALERFLSPFHAPPVFRKDYPALATGAMAQDVHVSSAAGEQPKFTCLVGQVSVLVKFSPPISTGIVARRWADLLVCEQIASRVLTEHGIRAAEMEIVDLEDRYFLESVRFDRTALGRRGMISMEALDAEFVGLGSNWSKTAVELCRQKRINEDDLATILKIELFAQMIGNTDRHHGNLSFMTQNYRSFELAPVYDMVPMMFAPSPHGEIVQRDFQPPAPLPNTIDNWMHSAAAAEHFWREVAASPLVSSEFRKAALNCREILDAQRRAAERMAAARLTAPASFRPF